MYRTFSKFSYHGSKLHYSVYGQGEKVMLMFHGYGHTLKNMRELEETLSTEFKIYNFDLFFHGFSEWNHNDTPLLPDFWQGMMEEFLLENGITAFSALGFSLGAKLALITAQIFPDKIEGLYLLAPDGIKKRWIYSFSTSSIMKSLFRSIIMYPMLFQQVVKFLMMMKLVDKSVLRFASIQMNSRDKRRRVYYTWTVFKGIAPNLEKLVTQLNKRQVKVEVFIGKYDRIIKAEHVKPLVDKMPSAILKFMNSGHNNLIEEVSQHILKELGRK